MGTLPLAQFIMSGTGDSERTADGRPPRRRSACRGPETRRERRTAARRADDRPRVGPRGRRPADFGGGPSPPSARPRMPPPGPQTPAAPPTQRGPQPPGPEPAAAYPSPPDRECSPAPRRAGTARPGACGPPGRRLFAPGPTRRCGRRSWNLRVGAAWVAWRRMRPCSSACLHIHTLVRMYMIIYLHVSISPLSSSPPPAGAAARAPCRIGGGGAAPRSVPVPVRSLSPPPVPKRPLPADPVSVSPRAAGRPGRLPPSCRFVAKGARGARRRGS